MSGRLLAALAPLAVALVVLVVWCEVDIVRARRVKVLPKWLWAIACVASVPLGAIAYLLVGRDPDRHVDPDDASASTGGPAGGDAHHSR